MLWKSQMWQAKAIRLFSFFLTTATTTKVRLKLNSTPYWLFMLIDARVADRISYQLESEFRWKVLYGIREFLIVISYFMYNSCNNLMMCTKKWKLGFEMQWVLGMRNYTADQFLFSVACLSFEFHKKFTAFAINSWLHFINLYYFDKAHLNWYCQFVSFYFISLWLSFT